MRYAILGGSFDPVHIGHLTIAEEALHQLNLGRVYFVPAAQPPHKDVSGGASDADRIAMLEIALAGRPEFVLEDEEIRRGGVSYTITTVEYFRKRHPEIRPMLIIGEDLVDGFTTWKRAPELATMVDLVLARRPVDPDGSSPELMDREALQGSAGPEPLAASASPEADAAEFPAVLLENPPLPVSSSLIRRRIQLARPYRYLLPQGVYDYLVQRGLYR